MKIYEDMTRLTGNTPMVRINRLAGDSKNTIVAKLEFFNPLSSVKDRIALSMIEDAEKKGLIDKDTLLVEPTSGNTGIGLAYVCAVKGYRLALTMPETMSTERKKLLKILGADIILTPGIEGMSGAVRKSEEIVNGSKNAFSFRQFTNPANPGIHRVTTAEEIWNDTAGNVDYFIAGVGTGGTITGVGEALKERKKDIKIIAVEPYDSPVLSGGNPGINLIQGLGAGFIPDVLNLNIIDEIITVKNEEAFAMANALAKKEGIFAGISSGAAMHAAVKVAKREGIENKLIIALLPDTGERYLSMDFWE